MPELHARARRLRERRVLGALFLEHVPRLLRWQHLRRGRPELSVRHWRGHMSELRNAGSDVFVGELPLTCVTSVDPALATVAVDPSAPWDMPVADIVTKYAHDTADNMGNPL